MLTPFDDRDVIETAVRITGAGTGLQDSLDVAPVELHVGQVVNVVLRATVAKVTHEQVKDSEELRRVHVLRTTFGSIVEEKAARKLLDTQRRVIEEAKGVSRLPGTEEPEG